MTEKKTAKGVDKPATHRSMTERERQAFEEVYKKDEEAFRRLAKL